MKLPKVMTTLIQLYLLHLIEYEGLLESGLMNCETTAFATLIRTGTYVYVMKVQIFAC